jgi:PAS domain S-box-containing protein
MLPQLIHPDDAPLVRRHLEACLSNRKDVVESRIVTNDGEIRWVRDYLEPDWDEKQGRVVRLYGATQDITARKQAEEALRASEERLRRLVESTNDLVILQDLEGHYLYYNGPSQYGLEVDDVLGTTPYDWFPADVADQIMDRIRQVAADRKKTTWEQGVVWKGETLWFLNSNFPVYDEAGRIAAIGTISHDITERKQAEVERERLVQELQTALAQVKQLKSLLPICSSCKKIRDDEGYWHQVEVYIAQHAGVDFSHGLCPDCKLKLYPPIQYPFLYEEEP